jgi:hypothetical protein
VRWKLFIIMITLNTITTFSNYVERETKYFKLIYDEKLSERVDEFSLNADKNGEKLFEFYNFKPEKKYIIIFRNNSDSDNGVTEYDTIKLYFNEVPVFYVEKNYTNWIDYLFVHELTHLILNLKSGGIIGKSSIMKPLLQQIFIPAWYQEGLAIYTESKLFEGGRGNSERFKMYINKAINEGEFEGFKFAGNYNIDGNNSYIYGYSFIEYFTAVYGEEELKKAVENFSKHQIKGPFYKAAGKKRDELLEEWKIWVKDNYKSGTGNNEGVKLINSFGDKRNLKYYDKKLYFYSDKFTLKEKNKGENGIFSIDIKNKKVKREIKAKIIEGFDLADNKIYYSMIIPDFIKGEKRAATFEKILGIRDEEYKKIEKAVNFFYSEKEIGVVIRDRGKESLFIGKNEIIPSEYGFKFEKFSYGENKIYFSASINNEIGNYIYSYNIKDKSIEKITEGFSPYFYKNNLYYSKKYKGIFNIYRITLRDRKKEQITDVKYGAFEPVVDEEGNIYYLNYNVNGYSIFKVEEQENNNSEKKQEKLYNKVLPEIKQEKNIIKNSKKFKDSMNLKSGVMTNKNLIFNFSNNFNEKKIVLINGKIQHAGQKFENYELYSEEKEEKLGIAALYIHSNGGIPLMILYTEKVEGEDGYISGNFNLPYFYRKNKLLFIGSAELDSYGKKNAGISLFGAVGYRAELEKKIVKNELYLKSDKIKINYYFSKKPSIVENSIFEGAVFNMKSSFKTVGYRFKTDEALVVRADTGYTFKINRGSKTGRTVFNSLRAATENIYAVWNNNGTRDEIVGVNIYLESDSYLNYNLNLKFRIGIIEQYDIRKNKILSGKEIPYIGFRMGI